jgi:hypothetical protein
MNVEIEAEAAQFPEKEYINWIFVAMQLQNDSQEYRYFLLCNQNTVYCTIL